MGPKIVVIYGGYAFERVRSLLTGMVKFPELNSFGQVMVELMAAAGHLSNADQRKLVERYLERFALPGTENPDFDKDIMFEALTYGARSFRVAWSEQVPAGIPYEDYRFHRWLGNDLVLERR